MVNVIPQERASEAVQHHAVEKRCTSLSGRDRRGGIPCERVQQQAVECVVDKSIPQIGEGSVAVVLPCVSGGQGRWTRSVTNLTRYMSPWQFWPKWEMGRLRTFKRLGAHAHRELKSPLDLQKGAPATKTLPPVAGEGKLPAAIPIFQPWSRCHRDYAGWLMTSVEAKRKHWQSRPARQQHATLILAPSLRKSWARRTLASRACGDLQTWSSTHTSQRVPAWKE